jgi:hypothetical protein
VQALQTRLGGPLQHVVLASGHPFTAYIVFPNGATVVTVSFTRAFLDLAHGAVNEVAGQLYGLIQLLAETYVPCHYVVDTNSIRRVEA